MKKTLIALLSVVICLSFVLTGCFADTLDPKDSAIIEDTGSKVNDTDTKTNTGADKNIVLNTLNKAFPKFTTDLVDFDKLLNAVLGVELGAELNLDGVVIGGNEVPFGVSAAVKDGVAYVRASSEEMTAYEGFVKYEDGTLTAAQRTGEDDWTSSVLKIADIFASANVNSSEYFDFINRIKMPECKEEHLSEKNGMVLVSNDYLVEIVRANIDLITELDQSVGSDKEDFIKQVEKAYEDYGIEIYIGTGKDVVTKVIVVAASEDFKLHFEINNTEDAKFVKSITVKVATDVTGEGIENAPESVINVEYIIKNEAVVGARMAAGIHTFFDESSSDFTPGDSYDYNTTTERVHGYATVNAVIDFSNITSKDADIFSIKVNHSLDESITDEEKIAKYNVDAELSVRKSGIGLDISGKLEVAGMNLTLNGTCKFADVVIPELPDLSDITPIAPISDLDQID